MSLHHNAPGAVTDADVASAKTNDDLIAIIGFSCRFPGANTLDEYWRNLTGGVESLTALLPTDLDAAGVAAADRDHPDFVPVAPLIEGADEFDAAFFGFTPREAEIRDPQGRLFLEHCYSAIEDAGHDPTSVPGHVGVFGGMANNYYGQDQVAKNARVRDAVGQMAIEVSNSPDYLCSAVSYRLGLHGPSITVQTACSSALVAIHLACQSLRAGECDFALAGGVEVELPYGAGYTWSEGGIYSKDGHIRPFSEDASGTIFGTGVGVALLRRLSDAIADGDPIHAVIRGSAVNNDGQDRAGFTAPGVSGQAMLIREALADAELDPSDVGYVEAHATGTLVGDPIEVEGLRRAFQSAGDTRRGEVPLGSVKGNIGHLGPAAGMAGLAKVCLALKNGVIPPTINVGDVNRRLNLDDSPFYVATEAVEWAVGKRRAGVSSFGIGGTNAHIIVEEAPSPLPSPPTGGPVVLPLSARTPTALAAARERLAAHLEARPETDLSSVAWTLQSGRARFDHRSAVVATDTAHAVEMLRAAAGSAAVGARSSEDIVLLLPGQGTQFPAMASSLWSEPAFRAAAQPILDLVRQQIGVDLEPLLRSESGDAALLAQTWVTQPLLFAVEVATARTLESWGLHIAAMAGHSIGELTAAYLSGVLSLEDAVVLVCARGRLMHSCPQGAMAAVAANWSDVAHRLDERIDLAAVNAPGSITIAGTVDDIAESERILTEAGVPVQRLRTSHAFHSALMLPALSEFERIASAMTWSTPRIPFVSGVTGDWITDAQATDPGYWADQIRRPVQFQRGAATVAREYDLAWVEAGPGRVLSSFVTASSPATRSATTLAADRRTGAVPSPAEVRAALWQAGAELSWERTWDRPPRRVSLPPYPFERRRYWVDADPTESPVEPADAPRTLDDGALGMPSWRQTTPTIGAQPAPGRWLVLCGAGGFGRAVAAGLTRSGADVILLGSGPWNIEGTSWTADLGSRSELAAAIHAFHGGTDGRFNVVDARVPDAPSPFDDVDRIAGQARARFHELLVLGQTLAAVGDLNCTVSVATANREGLGGNAFDPAEAIVSGPVLLMGREIAGVAARSIDVDLRGRGEDVAASDFVTELGRPDPAARVALRADGRYTLEYSDLGLPEPERLPVREGATYIVTGGLGGLGLEAARVLAEAAPARLVLLGRRGLPDRRDWHLIRESDDRRTASRIQQIEDLEALGASVTVRSVDVSLAEDVERLSRELAADGHRVAGVVHCAGVAGGGMLAMRTPQEADAVLAPKLAGTTNLYRAFGSELDFFLLYSSITAVTGTFGMVDYCAANNFVDAFAQWASERGTRSISIGWGGWTGVGMVEDLNAAAPAAFRALQDGADVSSADHPLLDRRLAGTAAEVAFERDLWPGRHWTSSEHVIGGDEAVVGAALIEMVRAAYAETVGGQPEITDVVHLQAAPVISPVVLRVRLRQVDKGQEWDASVEISSTTTATREWTPLLVAVLRPTSVVAPRSIDLGALAASLPGELTREELDRPSAYLSLGSRWRIASTRHDEMTDLVETRLPDYALAELCPSPDPDAPANRSALLLHPAILDVAVAEGQHNPMIQGRDETYLPMSYELIRWRAPLTGHVFSHIRHRDDRSSDVTVVDADLYDASGELLCEVRGFAMRRIDRGRFTEGMRDALTTAAVPATSHTDRSNITVEVGKSALRRILAGYPLSHIVVTPEGVNHAIRAEAGFDVELVEERLSEVHLGADRTADADASSADFRMPSSHVEVELARIWSSVLGVDRIGLDDNFFDLGGNSLVAVQVASRIRTLIGRSIGITTLFDNQTLGTLAESLESVVDRNPS
ncbi:SDR family NAD(P)-dependent oxidoreductase [Microbacterium sp. 16-032]|uniref:type I polyketide synthase n=1 Tax=Microbacterium sp. 16-032 TaxID=3239808 RepID=UPI0034E1B370